MVVNVWAENARAPL